MKETMSIKIEKTDNKNELKLEFTIEAKKAGLLTRGASPLFCSVIDTSHCRDNFGVAKITFYNLL